MAISFAKRGEVMQVMNLPRDAGYQKVALESWSSR